MTLVIFCMSTTHIIYACSYLVCVRLYVTNVKRAISWYVVISIIVSSICIIGSLLRGYESYIYYLLLYIEQQIEGEQQIDRDRQRDREDRISNKKHQLNNRLIAYLFYVLLWTNHGRCEWLDTCKYIRCISSSANTMNIIY